MSIIKDFLGWSMMLENSTNGNVDSISLVKAGRLLKPGRYGEAVKQVQRWLNVTETGEYDNATISAVKKFQKDNPPLVQDGIVGKLTIAQLISKFMNKTEAEKIAYNAEHLENEPQFVPDPIADSDNIKFPIVLSGSYTVDNSIPNKGDALHSFDRRKSDKFGGRMLRGWEDNNMKSKFGRLVTLDQNLGINQVLKKLIDLGLTPDVEDIQIDMKGNKVYWKATIVKSKDGKSWAGIDTRGSAGGGKQNALNQVDNMKRNNPDRKNWTIVHEIDRPGLNQLFLKYMV